MKKEKRLWGILVLLILVSNSFLISAQESQTICSVYFTGVGCPHCAAADPKILQEYTDKYSNFIVIEYEIYQLSENGKILNDYISNSNAQSGIPQILIGSESESGEYSSGEGPSTTWAKQKIETLDYAKCKLSDGSEEFFEEFDIEKLPGKFKVWTDNRILIKENEKTEENQTVTTWVFQWNNNYDISENKYLNENDSLKKILFYNIEENILNLNYEEIEPTPIALSGSNVEFENAIIFQTTLEKENAETEKLTLAKLISLAAVDAVNPCALAVLTLMLVAILTYNPRDKKKLLLAGLAFSVSVFIMYLIYGLIIIKSFQLIQALTSVRIILYKILGGFALILGVLNVRDYIVYRPGRIGTEMPIWMRPKLKKLIEGVTSPKGAFIIGLFVTLFLLPCTIGPYIIAGGILSAQAIVKAIPPLLLYNLIFVLPMVILTFIVYRGFAKVEDISGWKDKNIRKLHLFAGVIMVLLGIAMILGLV
jgi:cytochrome c biogenesis protein CcdA/glutaredoxin